MRAAAIGAIALVESHRSHFFSGLEHRGRLIPLIPDVLAAGALADARGESRRRRRRQSRGIYPTRATKA